MTISGRPTIYAGIPMRSRLEAAFAEHLDRSGKTWSYEGDAYASPDGQYLPDFHTPPSAFHEIKAPNGDFDQAMRRMHVVLASISTATLAVWTRPDQDQPFRIVRLCNPKMGCGRCARPATALRTNKKGAAFDMAEILRWAIETT